MKNEAIVLCGGLGTRLRPVFDGPKCMAPVDGRPFLAHVVDRLRRGRNRIILAVGYKKEAIMEYFGDSVEYSVETEPLGTGGAVREALKLAKTQRIRVHNGDTYAMMECGQFEIQGEPPSVDMAVMMKYPNIINAGMYILERTANLPKGPFSFEEWAWRQRDLVLHPGFGFFVDIGTPEGYERAKRELKNYVE